MNEQTQEFIKNVNQSLSLQGALSITLNGPNIVLLAGIMCDEWDQTHDPETVVKLAKAIYAIGYAAGTYEQRLS
jgi:hypothetical protein